MHRPAVWCVYGHIQSLPIPVWCPYFKMAIVVPVPKKAETELNNYCPVALTSVIMKCFERLFNDHITTTLPATLDPLQFAYCPNWSTDDAITITLPYRIWARGISMLGQSQVTEKHSHFFQPNRGVAKSRNRDQINH